jgi:hypothetical protein
MGRSLGGPQTPSQLEVELAKLSFAPLVMLICADTATMSASASASGPA